METLTNIKVWVFNIERFAIQDGPGIRTCVFLQGCPLRCQWCANPESQTRGAQLMHLDGKCTGCGACVDKCPRDAINLYAGKAIIDRNRCIQCGECVNACLQGANQLSGKLVSLQEIYEIVLKDADYYKSSGGGVTFSGGEALSYSRELLPLMQIFKAQGISVAVETCGQVAWEQFECLLPYVDYFLYDIKSPSAEVLREYAEGNAEVIIGNLEKLANVCKEKITLRIPVIPEVNFSEEIIKEIFVLGKQLGIQRVDLLPYHTLGMTKYAQLGREYSFTCTQSLHSEELNALQELGEALGLTIIIGGL